MTALVIRAHAATAMATRTSAADRPVATVHGSGAGLLPAQAVAGWDTMRRPTRTAAFLIALATSLIAAAHLVFRTDVELELACGLLGAAVL